MRLAGVELGSAPVVVGPADDDPGTLLAVDTVRRLREVRRLPVRVVGVPGVPSLNVHPGAAGVADVVVSRPGGVPGPPYSLAHRLSWLSGSSLSEAAALLEQWRADVARWAEEPSKPMCAEVVAGVLDALEDDLDTRTAVAVLQRSVELGLPGGCLFETWAWADRLLGLDLAAHVGRS